MNFHKKYSSQQLDRLFAALAPAQRRAAVACVGEVVWGVVFKRIRNPSDYDDVIQLIMIQIEKSLSTVDDRPIKPWLGQVARNTAIAFYRANERKNRLNQGFGGREPACSRSAEGFDRVETADEAADALSGLSAADTALMLHGSLAELAVERQVSENALRIRRTRHLAAIRKRLEDRNQNT